MWPVMIMMAEPKSTRSEPKSRSANQAPRIVERYTPPPYAPTSPAASDLSIESPPWSAVKYM
ncbi:hypothetical protein AHiyo1_29310 [Arthrobacter sp. Hiyo1]|nr:hypothetical protein AHiyo1_29310 [Arthrobacter sp. Hiyo1]